MSLFRNSPFQGVRTIISGISLLFLAFIVWMLFGCAGGGAWMVDCFTRNPPKELAGHVEQPPPIPAELLPPGDSGPVANQTK